MLSLGIAFTFAFFALFLPRKKGLKENAAHDLF